MMVTIWQIEVYISIKIILKYLVTKIPLEFENIVFKCIILNVQKADFE